MNLKNCLEKLKDFSDSIPIFYESDEEPIESLIICEQSCDLSSLEPEFMVDNEQAIVEQTVLQPEHPSSFDLFQQVFKEEPLNFIRVLTLGYLWMMVQLLYV